MLPPFNLMPRSALTAAGDAVMGQLMRTLLPLFMNKVRPPCCSCILVLRQRLIYRGSFLSH